MSSVLDIIANETNGRSFKTYKYGFDGIEVPRFDYDDHRHHITWKRYGETEYFTKPISISYKANKILSIPPMFTYFLDGSRKTYKVDDMSYKNRVYPIIAGQVGVGCCVRDNMEMKPLYGKTGPRFKRHLVIALPDIAKPNDWVEEDIAFENIRKKINERPDLKNRGIHFDKILSYTTSVDIGDKIENKGIAKIQDYMVEQEKILVAELVKDGYLLPDHYLMKDGSLEYPVHHIVNNRNELERFKNNYQFVVGVSKSFNPENCVDKSGKNNSNLIAELPLYHRTPVNMYSSERIGDVDFAVWFVRIRDRKYTSNAFDGILKIEKILLDSQKQDGISTDEVDAITANIINERNPVCYGADNRWANHLYPVYVTESFVKSKYLGESLFLNLF